MVGYASLTHPTVRCPPRALHHLAPCVARGIEALPRDLDHGDDRFAILLMAGDHAVAHDEERMQQVARLRQRRVDIGALADDLREKGLCRRFDARPPNPRTLASHGGISA